MKTELAVKANELIAIYRRRAANKEYEKRINRCMIALSEAANSLHTAAKYMHLSGIDADHVANINFVLSTVSNFAKSFAEFEDQLLRVGSECKSLARTLHTYTGVKETRGRGRPSKNLVSETESLIRLYEQETGEKVVFPKAHKGQAAQRSTEIIRRWLSEIDPSVDTKQSITLIRNARIKIAEIDNLLKSLTAQKKG